MAQISSNSNRSDTQENLGGGLKNWVAPESFIEQKTTGPDQPDNLKQPMLKDRETPVAPTQPSYGYNKNLAPQTQKLPERPEHILNLLYETDFSELRQFDTPPAAAPLDALRIKLRDGKQLQMASVDLPSYDTYDPDDLSRLAKQTLDELVTNNQIRLYQTKNPKIGRSNRMGHMLVHAVRAKDDLWIQGEMLARGLLMIRPTTRNPEMASQMIALQDYARENNLGIWAQQDKYTVLSPETARKGLGKWSIIEGTVTSAALVKNRLYLNFGKDWRTDFTIGVEPNVRRKFSKLNINLQEYGGKKVRVHGWVEDYNGPFVRLLHPVWLEIRE